MIKIASVAEGSAAGEAGVKAGDYLIAVNGHEVGDVLDYDFYMAEPSVVLTLHRGPELFELRVKKKRYADAGLGFDTYLMDGKRSCRNKCVFCFIDQLPPGMRETLYFKDDDTRLSFLQGNYVTLTNLGEKEIERIIKLKTSPINISVHTTDPELRIKMLRNRFAGEALAIIRRFAESGIIMNCQIVLCRGLNDGAALRRTMDDLAPLYPKIASVSVVPAGLTKFRGGLYPLEPFTPAECATVIKQVEAYSRRCKKEYGSRIFFCADEFYIKAGLPLRAESWYEGYPQLDNGVGLIASMKAEFAAALRRLEKREANPPRAVSIATGESAFAFISELAARLCERRPGLKISVYKIENRFFGPEITVAGLVTGGDIIAQLKGRELGETLFLPSVMLRAEGDMFLDDLTPADVQRELKVKVEFIRNDGAEFVRRIADRQD